MHVCVCVRVRVCVCVALFPGCAQLGLVRVLFNICVQKRVNHYFISHSVKADTGVGITLLLKVARIKKQLIELKRALSRAVVLSGATWRLCERRPTPNVEKKGSFYGITKIDFHGIIQ